MAKYTAESKYIASIYPGHLDPLRISVGPNPQVDSRNGFCTVYAIPPVKRGEKPQAKLPANVKFVNGCYVLEVSDSFEKKVDNGETMSQGRTVWTTSPVSCDWIVANILDYWTGHMINVPNGMKPGIMEIANTSPTQAERERMEADQRAFFEWCFAEGERLDRDKNWKDITEPMRLACDWLGYKRSWANPAEVGSTINCPACQESIHESAAVCRYCGTRLKALPEHIAALNPKGAIAPPLRSPSAV